MLVSMLCAFVLDNTIPGTREERGLTHWDMLSGSGGANPRNDPAIKAVYDLPFGLQALNDRYILPARLSFYAFLGRLRARICACLPSRNPDMKRRSELPLIPTSPEDSQHAGRGGQLPAGTGGHDDMEGAPWQVSEFSSSGYSAELPRPGPLSGLTSSISTRLRYAQGARHSDENSELQPVLSGVTGSAAAAAGTGTSARGSPSFRAGPA
mmetsp:Transcript_27503/g.60172  ORF Transcript_27503/g.60172 Transcript_27503/m.60172 type:complete len:210 (+) Transcript_27503:1458-2087(+)